MQAVHDKALLELAQSALEITDLKRRSRDYMKRAEELEKMKKTSDKAISDARAVSANLEKQCEELKRRNTESVVLISELQSTNNELGGRNKELLKEKDILSK